MTVSKSMLSISILAGLTLWLGACSSTGESAGAGSLVAHVGEYPPPPSGITRVKVGIPQFSVSGANASADMNGLAADQLSTLMVRTRRFKVIERAQLDKLLQEQDLEGIVKPGELAGVGEIHGVELLLVGKVTDFRVKTTKTKSGVGIAKVADIIGLGDVEKEDVEISTDCGVDLRLVDPTTGEVVVANFSEYNRMDTASSMGIEIFGANASADAKIEITESDYGKILRLALDDALRKMLTDVDVMLIERADATEG